MCGLRSCASGEEPTCPMQANVREAGSIPRSGRSPGWRHGNPLQCSWLENPMKRGAWWAIVLGVTKSQTRLSTQADKEWPPPLGAVDGGEPSLTPLENDLCLLA